VGTATANRFGEQAQVDWAHVGEIAVPGGRKRSLRLLLMVLSWSRAALGEFCFDTIVHSPLQTLVRAARFFRSDARRVAASVREIHF
jgi:hypothetical protein